MSRRRGPRPQAPVPPVQEQATPSPPANPEPTRDHRRRFLIGAAVALLLALQVGLAADSLARENPTVDEVAHLPAGVSYWQRGTFKLYHHNPPLVKLVAAAPVVLAKPNTASLYDEQTREGIAWRQESQGTFGEFFTLLNADRYFELFTSARLMMVGFLVVGGLAVFAWSAELYGSLGGLLSLALWTLCPNILAHGRLVTSDAASASLSLAATYLFWRFLRRPGWTRAVLAGVVLGLAQLTKFSALILYGLWPMLALIRWPGVGRNGGPPMRALAASVAKFGATIVAVSVLVINLGYGFEGTGDPLGRFEFASRSLTRPTSPGMARPTSPNDLLAGAWRFRINRFRGTIPGALPVPLPRHYVLGFDEQKIETEGIPIHFFRPDVPIDDSETTGYPVYLNGTMRETGWWYYYLATLAYKVPEGTWILVVLGGVVLLASPRSRVPWADELAVLAIPVGVMLAMSFLTDINLGLRYILPIFPFTFVATGKLAPWAAGLTRRAGRRIAIGVVAGALALTALATASIHPNYLAYFNWVSGGPDRGSEHLIDSNLDWGQDLVKLGRWVQANRPGARVGLAYFGQINPTLLTLRGEGFPWFLPPAIAGTFYPIMQSTDRMIGPAQRLTPGLYVVSASIVRGLPWRFHDSMSLVSPRTFWSVAWRSVDKPDVDPSFSYFSRFEPIARVGHSIFVYELSAEDCERLNRELKFGPG